MLTREEVARWVGLSEEIFQERVNAGNLPQGTPANEKKYQWTWEQAVAIRYLRHHFDRRWRAYKRRQEQRKGEQAR